MRQTLKPLAARLGPLLLSIAGPSLADQTSDAAAAETIIVTAAEKQVEQAQSSSQGQATTAQLAERPISRAGELLELVPGLMVTQHSGEGKANQYFLRGFNLDHGTDFYTEVDGLPVNMRTHAHGQGYADINFIIPGLIDSLQYRKGPYYADVGDFSSAGSAQLRYVESLPANIAEVSLGEFGYRSALLAGSPHVLDGHLLLGAQLTHYDGPFALEENVRKVAGIAKYSRGSASDGFSASLMSYDIRYNAPDQIPQRAVDDGQIDRFGVIDRSDGGKVGRYSANLQWHGRADQGRWQAQVYAMKYRMQLYSNFTYFLDDPVNGDQFNQFDDRRVYGLNARRDWSFDTAIPLDISLGLQTRYDDVDPVGLYKTRERQRISTVREDRVQEGSSGVYLSSGQQWTPWLRSQIGLRADFYDFEVKSLNPQNSGTDSDAIVSPKLAVIIGPWQQTRLFLNYGEGFHSNDARGLTTTVDPLDGITPQDKVDALVKSRGGEIGLSSNWIPDVVLSASLWYLDFDSELVYVGDAGANEPSASSERRGVEVSAYYALTDWLAIDADYAYAHARLNAEEGNRIPNSIRGIFAIGATVPNIEGWSAGIRLRHLGAGPLVEDNSARSKSTTVVNAQVGKRLQQNLSLTLQVLNLLDSRDNDITYFYESRLPGEPDEGVADTHFHPVEPRAARLTLNLQF